MTLKYYLKNAFSGIKSQHIKSVIILLLLLIVPQHSYALWTVYATDDYFDGIVAGATINLDVTHNDTIGGVPYGSTFPIEIIATSSTAQITIENNQIVYSPNLNFSGLDNFSYIVDHNGALDTANVLVMVFDAPGNIVEADCYVQMPEYEWGVESAFESPDNDINPWTTPLVGDLFGDDYPEIVAKDGNGVVDQFVNNYVYVYHGSSTPLQSGSSNFNTASYNCAATTMAIAKIETATGLRPTLFVASTDRTIYAYNPENGDEYWQSGASSAERYCKELGNDEGAFIGIADFNNDNEQEVYAANRIYNAATGDLLCSGGNSTDVGYFKYGNTLTGDYSSPTHHMMHSVTGDFDGDGDLELAAGRYVFDVDIASGTMPVLSNLPTTSSSNASMIKDGSTVVADIDLDGDLDVIVTHQTTRNDFYCYVWDGQTPTLIAEKYIRNDFADPIDGRYGNGVPFVGDLNGDGRPEIAFTTSNRQYALSYSSASTTLQEYYTLEHSDKSGYTGLTLFDFNNDDIAEIIYRDETDLRIINASGISHKTGNDTLNADNTPILYNLASYACESSTQSEFAVVADVDLDGQAEIVVTNNTRLNIFESAAGSKWVTARPVWNQYGYNVTNVKNDLTIPRYALNNSMTVTVDSITVERPFNHFLQQMGNITHQAENVLLTPDLYVGNSSYSNNGTTATMILDIVNQGDINFQKKDSVVSFYCGDPNLGGSLLAVGNIPENISKKDTLRSITYTFPVESSSCPNIFIRLNDDGYSSFPDIENIQQECDYDNNLSLADTLPGITLNSHFTWNGYDLDKVALTSGDTSDASGMIFIPINRGDSIDILPHLDGYVFKALSTSLDEYVLQDDEMSLQNIQESGSFTFKAYKIPEVLFNLKMHVYNQTPQDGDVSVTSGVNHEIYYKNSNDTSWTTSQPDSVGYYDMKVICYGDSLFTAYGDSIDSILVITPRPVTFSLDVEDKIYDASDSVISFTSSHDVLAGDSLVLDVNTMDLYFSDESVGVHSIFLLANWSMSGPDANNYYILPYDTVSAEITKPLLIIRAVDATKTYDGLPFAGGNGVVYDGFLAGEGLSDLSGTLSYTGSSQSAVDTGYYDIIPSGYSSINYDILYVSGTLRIISGIALNSHFSWNGYDLEKVALSTGDTSDVSGKIFMPINRGDTIDILPHLDGYIFKAMSTSLDEYVMYDDGMTLQDIQDNGSFTFVAYKIPEVVFKPKTHVYNQTPQDGDVTVTSGVDHVIYYRNSNGVTWTTTKPDSVGYYDMKVICNGDNLFTAYADSIDSILNITPRPVLFSIDVADKSYDASDSVTSFTSTHDALDGDSIVLDVSIMDLRFSDESVGIHPVYPLLNWSISGPEANNYYILPYDTVPAEITKPLLTIRAVDATKTYDGLPFAGGSGVIYDGFLAGEDASDLSGTLSYTGTSQLAVDTGSYEIVPSGYSSVNYEISYVSGSLRINPRIMHVNYGGADTIVYSTVVNMMNYVPQTSDLAVNDQFYNDVLSFGEDFSSSGNYTAGDHDLEIGEAYILNALGDTVNDNYIFTFSLPTIHIDKMLVSVINAQVQDKVYDNTTKATISGAMLTGIVPGDDVKLGNSPTGSFENENVGVDIPIYTDVMVLYGADKLNYALISQPNLIADITPREVYYTLDSVEDKSYDGTDSIINIIRASTNDTIYNDGVSLDFKLLFATSEASQDIIVNATMWKLQGALASNYILLPYAGDMATINKINLSFKANDVSRFYGQGNGALKYDIEGFVNDEDVLVLDELPSLASDFTANTFVGEYPDAFYLEGGYDNNYNYTLEHGDLTIKKVAIHVDYLAEDTLIYGDNVDGDDYNIASGQMVNRDSLYLGTLNFGNDTSGSGHYNVGLHTITPGEIRAKNEAGLLDVSVNYDITFSPAFVTYIPKPVYVDIEAKHKTYDGTTTAELSFNQVMDVYPGDEVDLDENESDVIQTKSGTVLNADFSDKNVADDKVIYSTSYSFDGADRKNYEIVIPDLEANIYPRTVTWSGNAFDKVYDGSNAAKLDTISLRDVVESDDVHIAYNFASFSQSDAGDNLQINLSDVHISGNDKENYIFDETVILSATIFKAELEIKPLDIEYVYGDSLPQIKIDINGFVNDETIEVLDETPVVNSELNSDSDVGYYTLEVDNGIDNNYNITYVAGQVTVLPRPLEIFYECPDQICSNTPLDQSTYEARNLAVGDDLDLLDFDISIVEDMGAISGPHYNVTLGRTIIRNEDNHKVTDNYMISMDPVQTRILDVPSPDLGDDLGFCGVCEYDFDAGEGVSYLWSTGDTTRYLSFHGNFRGKLWVEVENENGCFAIDTVSIALDGKYLKNPLGVYIYPNPSMGQFKVELSREVTNYASIYDMSGNLIRKVIVDGNFFEVDIKVPDAVYILEIEGTKESFLIENSMVSGSD